MAAQNFGFRNLWPWCRMDCRRACSSLFLFAAGTSLSWVTGGSAAPAPAPAPSVAPASATAPATAAAVAPDLSSPKTAILSLYAALRAGDIPGARRCLLFADARQEETFELTVTPVWAPLALMHALESRFGEGARQPFSCASLEKSVDKAVEDLERAQIAITGGSAVIAEKRAAVDPAVETEITGIALKRQGDEWRIVATTFPDITAEIPGKQVPVMRALAGAVSTACQNTLQRLAKGEFKSADEAYAAYQSQLQAGVRAASANSSRNP